MKEKKKTYRKVYYLLFFLLSDVLGLVIKIWPEPRRNDRPNAIYGEKNNFRSKRTATSQKTWWYEHDPNLQNVSSGCLVGLNRDATDNSSKW